MLPSYDFKFEGYRQVYRFSLVPYKYRSFYNMFVCWGGSILYKAGYPHLLSPKRKSPWNDLHKMVSLTDLFGWSLEQKKAGKNPKTWQEIGKK